MIAFLLSPFGKIIGIVGIIALAFLGFRVWLAAHDHNVLSGYVLQSEKMTAEAKANEMERQRNAAAQALTENEKRQAADEAFSKQLDAQNDKELSDYETRLKDAKRDCTADNADADFIMRH